MRDTAIYLLATATLLTLRGPVRPVPTGAAQVPADVYVYQEGFSSYTHKAYTQETDWNTFTRRLALLPMSGSSYTEPAIAADGQGGAYVVWKDWRNRNIVSDADIYAQRVDGRGSRLWAAGLRVNSDNTQAYQSAPAIVVDSQGNALVVWADIRETPYAIYAQKMSPAGAKLWASDVRVNGAPAYRVGWGELDSLAVAIDSQDNVVVVWQGNWDNNWSDPDVYAQKIGPGGQRLWANDIRVNADVGHGQYYMAVGVDVQGTVVVAWVDDRNGGEDIYAQRLDANGSRKWPADVKVSAGSGVLHQGDPNVIVDSQGNAVIVWRSGPADPPIDWEVSTIYAQKVNPSGTLQWAGNVSVNRDTTHVFRGRPCADLAPGDDVLVIWEDNRRGYSTQGIFAQRLSPAGTLRWAADLSISPDNWWGQKMSGLSVEGNRTYITWSRWGDLYVQILDLASSSLLLPVPALINDTNGRADQCEADVAPLSNGRAIVVWVDTRRFNHDVRAQAINLDRQVVWPADFEVNDPELVDHWKPQVAANARDRSLVVWNDGRNGIYGQLMDASGLRLWPADRRMNADDRWVAFADVAALPDNTFVVAWIGQRQPYGNLWDVYLQRVDEAGNRLWDHDVPVNTGDYHIPLNEVEERSRPAVAVDAQGHFVVAWRGDTGSAVDLYVRRVSSDGTSDWSQDLPLNSHLSLSNSGSEVLCAIVADSQITVAWSASWSGHWGIYAQRLSLNGQTLWGPKWVSEVATQVFYGNPGLALTQSGDVVVVWDDEHQQGRNVYAQLLGPTGNLRWPEALRLNQADVWPLRPAVSMASDGTFIAAWHDGRYADDSICAQRFNTSGALLWSGDLELFPPGSEWYYYLQGVAESTTVDETSASIPRASLTVSQTLNGGSVDYFLSNDGGQMWEETAPGELHTFSSVGSDLRWKAILYASSDLYRSPVIQSLTIRYGSDVIGDAFEPDNTCDQAQPILPDGTVQHHNFHASADVDWVTFDVVSGTTYLIEVQVPVGSPADVALELYGACGNLPLGGQDYAFAPGVRLAYRATTHGPLYLRLLNHTPTVHGPQVAYDLSVQALNDEATPGAVVIVAGRLKDFDSLQNNIHQVAGAAYQLFIDQGYTDDRIYYLATDLGLTGVDALSTAANLQAAITTWALGGVGPSRPFTLFMVDHGDHDQFYLDKPHGEWVTPSELDNWLTYLETARPGVKVNVIVEACYSGSFIDLAQTISRRGRVVITSTGAWNQAYASGEGAVFSDHFLVSLGQQASLCDSFQAALWAAQSAHLHQTPWLDDDGDGVANEEEDGQEAAQRGFGYAGTLAGDIWPPYIVQADGPADIDQGRGTIRARVLDDERVSHVWVVVYPPSYRPPQGGDEMIRESVLTVMLLDQGGGWYGATYTGFDEIGSYRVVIYAEDNDGFEARPLALEVRTGWAVYMPLVLRNR